MYSEIYLFYPIDADNFDLLLHVEVSGKMWDLWNIDT